MSQQKFHCESGLSLIELLIAMFLSLSLAVFCIKLLYSGNQNFKLFNANWHITQNALAFFSYLNQIFDRAGYAGCNHLELLRLHSVDISMLPASYQKRLQVDSDSVAVGFIDNQQVELIKQPNLTQLIISHNLQYNKDSPLMISDCLQKKIFNIAKITKQNTSLIIDTKNPLSFIFHPGAIIGPLKELRLIVAKTTYDNSDALYEVPSIGQAREIISNVVALRFFYTTQTMLQQPHAIFYTGAEISAQHLWLAVKAIKVVVVLSSAHDALASKSHYVFLKQKILAKDKKLYRVFSTIMVLKNEA